MGDRPTTLGEYGQHLRNMAHIHHEKSRDKTLDVERARAHGAMSTAYTSAADEFDRIITGRDPRDVHGTDEAPGLAKRFDEANTGRDSGGRRHCKACDRDKQRKGTTP